MKIIANEKEIKELKESNNPILSNAEIEEVKFGSITDEEINRWAKFSDHEKSIIKEQYAKYPDGFFPNPWCALR